ncbi:hypothetical protein NW759_005916 [Fusarium solani]|nr:hypothetical protein NW759_005916 [Fusarium solani]
MSAPLFIITVGFPTPTVGTPVFRIFVFGMTTPFVKVQSLFGDCSWVLSALSKVGNVRPFWKFIQVPFHNPELAAFSLEGGTVSVDGGFGKDAKHLGGNEADEGS